MDQHGPAYLLALAGLDPWPAGHLTVTGSDPVFPTRYRIGSAGAAVIAAFGAAAALVWRERTGRTQAVHVATRHAAAALRSARYLRVDGALPPEPWDKLSGFHPVVGGRWISIHCNFPVHRDAALRVLNLSGADRDSMSCATGQWEGSALEDAIHAAGGCAGFVRTPAEWAHHPQHDAVAAQPLLDLTRIGDAPPMPIPPGDRPLAGVRVLDLTRVLAGPTCARALAEQGADVLKVNSLDLPNSGAVEIDTGMGKRATHIDLNTPEGPATLARLAAEADVFSQSYRPGTLAARGFSPERLAEIRPGIVCVTLSAWGTTGPWALRRGFDTIVQSVSGMADVSAANGRPRYLPVSAIDYVSGYLMALGTIAALIRRAREGGSWHVRVSLARTGRWIVDHGLLDPSALAAVSDELPDTEIAQYCQETQTPFGRVRHLAPVAQLSETPGRWIRPAVPLGTDAPNWPATHLAQSS